MGIIRLPTVRLYILRIYYYIDPDQTALIILKDIVKQSETAVNGLKEIMLLDSQILKIVEKNLIKKRVI